MIPSWARDPKISSRLINARMESITEKPSLKVAVARRRCLVPATGYCEWDKRDGAGLRHAGVTCDASTVTDNIDICR